MKWIAGGIAVLWLFLLIQAYLGRRYRLWLKNAPFLPDNYGTISVIVTTRNDQDCIKDTIERLLSIDYPSLEIIVVNDRSTDSTQEIVESLAKKNTQLKVVSIPTLPQLWVGKCHAMNEGLKRAIGEYILFIDSNSIIEPTAISKALHVMHHEKLDHLSCVIEVICKNSLIRIISSAYLVIYYAFYQMWRVNIPSSQAYYGFGPFNLFRRTALEKIGAMESVRMEVNEDMALAALIRKAGLQQKLLLSDGEVRFTWIESPWGVVRIIEKNAFSAFGYHYLKCVIAVSLIGFFCLSPYMFLFWWADPFVFGCGLVAIACIFVTYAQVGASWFDWRSAIGFPIGCTLVVIAVLNSAFQCRRRQGIVWRDTFYPLIQLRQHMAYKR